MNLSSAQHAPLHKQRHHHTSAHLSAHRRDQHHGTCGAEQPRCPMQQLAAARTPLPAPQAALGAVLCPPKCWRAPSDVSASPRAARPGLSLPEACRRGSLQAGVTGSIMTAAQTCTSRSLPGSQPPSSALADELTGAETSPSATGPGNCRRLRPGCRGQAELSGAARHCAILT